MEGRIMVIRMMLIALLLFLVLGCSRGGPIQSVEQNGAISVNVNGTTANVTINAQRSVNDHGNKKPNIIKGGVICEDYLLKKIAAEKAEDSQMVKLTAFNTDEETLSPDLKKWLDTANEQKLVVLEFRRREKTALVFGSYNTKATGLASNFQNWYIRLDSQSIIFLSLSEDPRLIFWDRSGLLNYYAIDYSNEFLKNKDWDNLSLDLLQYRINPDGESQLVSEERNLRCE